MPRVGQDDFTPGNDNPAVRRSAFNELVGDLRLLRYDTLFPLGQWIRDQPWKLGWVRGLLFFALGPLALAVVFQTTRLEDVAWALGAYFSLIWGGVLFWVIQPQRLQLRQVLLVAGFTLLIGMLLDGILQGIFPLNVLFAGARSTIPLFRLVGFVVGVGVLEEACKALPLIWLALKVRQVNTPRELAFLGAVSGLAFGIAEAVSYSSLYATQHLVILGYESSVPLDAAYGRYLLSQVLRLTSLPFLHAGFSTIVGYYVGLAALKPDKAPALIVVGVGAAAILHGLYDFTSGSLASVAVAGAVILLVVSYSRSADSIGAALEAGELERTASA